MAVLSRHRVRHPRPGAPIGLCHNGVTPGESGQTAPIRESAKWTRHNRRVGDDSVATERLRDLALLRRVRDRMDREFDQPLNVDALARDVHMSSGHLSRSFKAAYGESPYSYLMTRRIERAMALFRRGDLSVTDVCFTVGFSSLGTFSTRFTELVGMPPSEYRRRAEESVAELPSCVMKAVSRPVRNREAPPLLPD